MRGLRRGQGSPGLEVLLRDGVSTGLTDKELMDRFTASRDPSAELAFATLVARHGPMVMNVCRRILNDPSDADDAFQATFLVLVRRAGAIHFGTSLGPWLYGVSVRVARRIRNVGARRAFLSDAADVLASLPDPVSGTDGRLDLRMAIDEGLDHLPDGYRSAVVLCHLEGLTHEEAADRLNCPVGTVRSRLARGRALLRGHLARLGLAPRAWGSDPATRPAGDPTPPVVPASLIEITARTAARLAAGQPLAGIVSARLAGIVAGVARSMMISKLALGASIVATAVLAAWGVSAGLAAPQSPAQNAPDEPIAPAGSIVLVAAQEPVNPAKKGRSAVSEAKAKVDPAILAELPAVVIRVEPPLGACDVDPALREIRVTFSKRMMDQNWSWVTYDPDMFPKVDGKIHYESDRKTCVLPVKLEPGKTYFLGINAERFRNFKDMNGQPALPYMVAFRTRAAR